MRDGKQCSGNPELQGSAEVPAAEDGRTPKDRRRFGQMLVNRKSGVSRLTERLISSSIATCPDRSHKASVTSRQQDCLFFLFSQRMPRDPWI
jgi:hypothetical protein